jgi:hypothetical protein
VGLLGIRRPLESTRDRGPRHRDLWPKDVFTNDYFPKVAQRRPNSPQAVDSPLRR